MRSLRAQAMRVTYFTLTPFHHYYRLIMIKRNLFLSLMALACFFAGIGVVFCWQHYKNYVEITVVDKQESNQVHQTAEKFISSIDVDSFLENRTVAILNGVELNNCDFESPTQTIVINNTPQIRGILSHSFEGIKGASSDISGKDITDRITKSESNTDRRSLSFGCAVIIHEEGYLLTAAHVVNFDNNVACLSKNKAINFYQARTVWKSEHADLALLHVDEKFDTVFEWAGSPAIDELVCAFGISGRSSGVRIKAALPAFPPEKAVRDYYGFDIPLLRGDSGGPTINMKGQLIGINIQVYFPKNSPQNNSHIGVVIAAEKDFINKLIADDQKRRP